MLPQLHLRHATEGVAVNAAPAADAVYAMPMKLDHTGQICGEAASDCLCAYRRATAPTRR